MKDSRGARDHVEVDVEERDGSAVEWAYEEALETLGDALRFLAAVWLRPFRGVPETRLIGVTLEGVREVVRCLDAYVVPVEKLSGPEVERPKTWLAVADLSWELLVPDTARLDLDDEGTRSPPREETERFEYPLIFLS